MTNPVWTVQAYQSTRGVTNESGKKEKPTAASALKAILKQDGIKGLWRGIGPALILVINPVIQVSLAQRRPVRVSASAAARLLHEPAKP